MKKRIFAFFVLYCILLSGCGQSTQGAVSSSSVSTDPAVSASSVQSNASISTPVENTDVVGILGSHITDVRLGLEQSIGMPQGGISHTKSDVHGKFITSSIYDLPGTGISLDYSLTCDGDYQITTGIVGLESTGLSSNDDVMAIAEQYLGYCITLPYDAADTDAAKQWLLDNIGNYAEQPQTAIGDAVFTLSGATNESGNIVYISLGIHKDTLDEQVIANMENE